MAEATTDITTLRAPIVETLILAIYPTVREVITKDYTQITENPSATLSGMGDDTARIGTYQEGSVLEIKHIPMGHQPKWTKVTQHIIRKAICLINWNGSSDHRDLY